MHGEGVFIRSFVRVALLASCALALGCVHSSPPGDRPIATDIDPASARPAYWLEKPVTQSVTFADYDRLQRECQHVLRQRRFEVDRVDYRTGVISTEPLISKQVWEVWRSDVADFHDQVVSSVGTHRRTVRWEIQKTDSAFAAAPKVVVERFTAPTHRITTVLSYQSALSAAESQTTLSGQNLKTIGEGNWYAVGRDGELEKVLAEDLRERLKQN